MEPRFRTSGFAQGSSTGTTLTFWGRSFFIVGALLFVVGCLGASQGSVQQHPSLSCYSQKYIQTLANAPGGGMGAGAKSPPAGNHWVRGHHSLCKNDYRPMHNTIICRAYLKSRLLSPSRPPESESSRKSGSLSVWNSQVPSRWRTTELSISS